MSTEPMRRWRWLAVGGLGLAALVTQLALLRELLAVFTGNELVLGIVLGSWLLLSGLGTALGRTACRLHRPWRVLVGAQILVGILPLLALVAVRGGRDLLFLRGTQVGVAGTVAGSVLLLAPFCLVSGYMLTLACALVSERREIGGVYIADNVGSILGGMMFSLVLVNWVDHFAALLLPALLNLALALWLARALGARLLAAFATLGLASLPWLVNLDAPTTAWQYPGQTIRWRGHSPYGRVVVTESAGQRVYYENGQPLAASHNAEDREPLAHYLMAQRPDAKRVLVLGGALTGTAQEILRYPRTTVTQVEHDPVLLGLANLNDPQIRTVLGDGRRYINQAADQSYDVILLDLPEPATLQLNRYYTAEFFAAAKRRLAPQGVLGFSLGGYQNYVSAELARLLASTRQSLAASFGRVLLLPGNRVVFLASDGDLTAAIGPRLPGNLKLLSPEYLAAAFAQDRLDELHRAAAEPAPANRDFVPVLYDAHLRHWLRQFPVRFGWLEAGLLLALAVYLLRLRAAALVVFAGGFGAAALELVLLLGFQVAYGSLYRGLGMLVTVFMAGLAAGAWWSNRPAQAACEPRRGLVRLALALAGLAVALPWAVRIGWLIAPLMFGLAALVGMQFPAACRLETADNPTTAGRLYTADFVGASLGALLASALLVPLIGLSATCGLTAGLNLIGALALWWRK